MFEHYLQDLPLIAILRGVTPEEIEPIGDALFETGFRVMEIPLNSPRPLESIRRLSARLGDRALIGAGTVLDPAQVSEVGEAGGRLIVSPHGDTRVIEATVKAGMVSSPGVATPTEGFAALNAGAHGLKLFPAEQLGPQVVKAWRAVFPAQTLLMPVGGVTPDNMQAFVDAGANGFGLGSSLYKAGRSVEEVRANAERFAAAWRSLG
ncbi:2-dehydro-3-deoxy-6-phosphogalactonate aldolase [Kushneria phosphatilytica]|uniref:2-dehydro-3-deoxy-6-phosphogalactonate aldolase n=1 Tax=Kushneria phosphatilytica TaxID=657387 RepID=A0A1S1NN71_9GAMM|nr:2-dehydro-3-deoxy-6-phosphogalactonate aldolase [Kushneria phosphatilytica]OHV08722.1 2-dehydro-3-deoxy-6-phosphogalactonate aldolase [Kushneria phosphatilytica]QEL12446.1 2-dehydro-3-deoxy-6-phosphogalactonate aldolase [Kushneria phosphatilytica]